METYHAVLPDLLLCM